MRSQKIVSEPDWINRFDSFTFYLQLDQASLGLSRKLLMKGWDEKIVKAYYDYMVDIAVIFGADRSRALKELKESVDLEIKLANVSIQ